MKEVRFILLRYKNLDFWKTRYSETYSTGSFMISFLFHYRRVRMLRQFFVVKTLLCLTHQKTCIKNRRTKFYCYDQKPGDVEFESDDQIHVDIKYNNIVAESDSEVTVQRPRNTKISIVCSSNGSKEEKSHTEEEKRKKTTFVESDSDVILNSGTKCKQIVCYENSESYLELI